MTEWLGLAWIHPSIVLILGALALPLLRGRLQQAYLLALPAVVLVMILGLGHGVFASFSFLGLDLVLGRVDSLSLVFAYVFGIILLIGAIFALHVKDPLQHVAALIYAGSSLGVVFAGDLISLYVFWELMVFSSVWLIWARRDRVSWGAGWRYILVHAAGGVILLSGIVLYYVETGSIAFDVITGEGLAFYLILIGFLVNAAAPPIHAWLTDAYPESTVTGGVFLCAFTTKTAVYVLLRGYPGVELLMWLGAIMTLWGVIFAALANDMRRLLSYHIISQVGYMVCGVGMGTLLALNGSAAHAFTHILYKALLFMGAGAVIAMTGRARMTELGGLYRYMPVTLVLYMVGAFSISAFPLFSGFISKTMIVESAAVSQQAAIWLMLSFAAAGTFLSTGLKLPYFVFFGKECGLKPQEAPRNMLIAMAIAAALCILLGIYPDPLYAVLMSPVDYNAYTVGHVLWELQLLLFAGLAFFVMIGIAKGKPKINLDTDWVYRRMVPSMIGAFISLFDHLKMRALMRLQIRLNRFVAGVYRHHGPQGILARTWPTGSTVLWVAVLLCAMLVLTLFV